MLAQWALAKTPGTHAFTYQFSLLSSNINSPVDPLNLAVTENFGLISDYGTQTIHLFQNLFVKSRINPKFLVTENFEGSAVESFFAERRLIKIVLLTKQVCT